MSVLSQLGRMFLLATLGFCTDAIHDAIVENPPLISDPELERSLMAVARMHNATALLQGTTKRMDERDVRYMFEVSQHKPRFATRKEFTKSLTPGQKFEILGAHITIIEHIVTHQAALSYLAMHVARRAAYTYNLIPHHQQWTEVLNPGLKSQPVHRCIGHDGCPPELERSSWPFVEEAVEALEKAIPTMRREFDAMRSEGLFTEHEEGIHITGFWDLIRIPYSEGKCDNQADRSAKKRCQMSQKSVAAFNEFERIIQKGSVARPSRDGLTCTTPEACWRYVKHPHVQEARFSTIHPNTVVTKHTASTNQRIKVHCGIYNPSGVSIHIANMSLTWKEDRCIVIDDSYEHHLFTTSHDTRRTILEIKFSHPDLRHAALYDDEGGQVTFDANDEAVAPEPPFLSAMLKFKALWPRLKFHTRDDDEDDEDDEGDEGDEGDEDDKDEDGQDWNGGL